VTAIAQALQAAGYAPAAIRLQRIAEAVMAAPLPPEEASASAANPTAAQRLSEIAMAAIQASNRNWTAARNEFMRRVQDDPELLWELFAPYRYQAVQAQLTAAAETLRRIEKLREVPRSGGGGGRASHGDQARPAPAASRSWDRPRQGSGGGHLPLANPLAAAPVTPRHPAAGLSAVAAVTRQSIIDTFQLNGRPIGDATPREARAWAGARERDARFVRLLTANLPEDQPIRRYRSDPDEVAALYAQAEAGHAE
jgi:hypothetical protein